MNKDLVKLANYLKIKKYSEELGYLYSILKNANEDDSSADLKSHADFIRAINDAFIDKESEDMLLAIKSKAESFTDKEFGEEVGKLCDGLVERLETLEDLRDEAGRYTW